MTAPLAFRVLARDGEARCGRLETPHGDVDTPAFMPVATFGAVRGVDPRELAEAGAQLVLANTYHLHERPGEAVVATLGGLSGFTGWSGPWLTDSGGYQVTSLAHAARLDEDGVVFTSPLDGARRQLSPEGVVAIQDFIRGRSGRAARFALVMLLRTEGGDTHELAELTDWMESGGLEDVRVEDVDADRQLVTAVRP